MTRMGMWAPDLYALSSLVNLSVTRKNKNIFRNILKFIDEWVFLQSPIMFYSTYVFG